MSRDPVSRDEAAVGAFVEHLGATLYDLGFPRMPARVLGTLTAAEGGALTAGEIGDRLQVSAAAVSGAVRYLVQVGLIVREPVPGSRTDRYRAMSNTWYLAAAAKTHVYRRVADVVDTGVEAVGADTDAGRRIAEMAAFFRFLEDEIGALIERWETKRLQDWS